MISQAESMASKHGSDCTLEEDWEEPARKRMRTVSIDSHSDATLIGTLEFDSNPLTKPHDGHPSEEGKDRSITIASTAKLGNKTIAPFLARHIPDQYAPLGSARNATSTDPSSKFCYRHRPDMLCRRQADEPTMEALQQDLDAIPESDRPAISQVWALFSAAPAKHRNTMLQGILAQCCFPQLSYLSANVQKLIKIDFLAALPSEVAFRILCFLDTTSLCKAAQVSRKWRQLSDDDVVWHRMCEQHISRKCTKCGWGLPLLDRKRLRATKRQMQLRSQGRGINAWSPEPTSDLDVVTPAESDMTEMLAITDGERSSQEGSVSPVLAKRPPLQPAESDLKRTRPWKDVYKDRFKVGTNWKYGRCNVKVFKGHTNGVMALQFFDNILATGSYDSTVKIWDMETGEELRTLTGHTSGIRCLQFDDTKLISGSLDNTLRIWNWRTGECLSTLNGHTAGVISLHFDSNILVSGSIDKTAKVWNFEDKSSFTLRGHSDWVNSVRIDTASRTVFTASDDCTVKLWDLDTKRCMKLFEGHVGQVQQVLPMPPEFEFEDEDEGAEHHSDDESVHALDVPIAGYDYALRSPSRSRANRPAFNFPDSRPQPPKYMLTSALDSTIRLWEVASGKCIRTFFGHVEGVWALAADTLRIVSGAEDRMVKVWDARSGKCVRTFTGHAGPVTCLDLGDSRMCTGGEDGEVRLYSFKVD
jgi:F-box/WD-40 domain protein MET30